MRCGGIVVCSSVAAGSFVWLHGCLSVGWVVGWLLVGGWKGGATCAAFLRMTDGGWGFACGCCTGPWVDGGGIFVFLFCFVIRLVRPLDSSLLDRTFARLRCGLRVGNMTKKSKVAATKKRGPVLKGTQKKIKKTSKG